MNILHIFKEYGKNDIDWIMPYRKVFTVDSTYCFCVTWHSIIWKSFLIHTANHLVVIFNASVVFLQDKRLEKTFGASF